jgi:hypothetical protein
MSPFLRALGLTNAGTANVNEEIRDRHTNVK